MVTTASRSEMVELTAADGHRLEAYCAVPKEQPRGGLVVIQDAFGLTDYIRSVCNSYAANGYTSIAPALYDRQQRNAVFDHSPEQHAASGRFRKALVWDEVMADIEAARAHLSGAVAVGILGFCVGGSAAWLAAAKLPFAAAVAYYGKDIVDWLDQKPRCPMMLHFGDNDHLIPLADVERIRGAYPDIPTFVYPAEHGFDSKGGEAAETARRRTLDHFRRYLG